MMGYGSRTQTSNNTNQIPEIRIELTHNNIVATLCHFKLIIFIKLLNSLNKDETTHIEKSN